MTLYEVHPDGTALLGLDGDGKQHVWTVTRDGGMATRGTYDGSRSAGIQWLYDQGPVVVLWSLEDSALTTELASRVRQTALTMPEHDNIERVHINLDVGYRYDPVHLLRFEIQHPKEPESILQGGSDD